jgi:hypothetical protein
VPLFLVQLLEVRHRVAVSRIEPDDFGDALKPEFKEQEKRVRAKAAAKAKKGR